MFVLLSKNLGNKRLEKIIGLETFYDFSFLLFVTMMTDIESSHFLAFHSFCQCAEVTVTLEIEIPVSVS